MKKLSRKGKVHPITYDDCLSFLPPTIFALTIVLSPDEKLVLAYLISCSSSTNAFVSPSDSTACGSKSRLIDHSACFNCNCFSCYMSYWLKWDASPNRQVIHDIIDAFEQGYSSSLLSKKNKKDRRKRSKGTSTTNELCNLLQLKGVEKEDVSESAYVEEIFRSSNGNGGEKEADGGGGLQLLQVEETDSQKTSLRSVLSFLGGKFWTLLLF